MNLSTNKTDAQTTDPIHALHTDAKAYPGGIAGMAAKIGRSAGVLYNKFSPMQDAYEITDREADALARAVFEQSGSNAYIEAKCAVHGGVFIPLPEAGAAGDDDVLSAILGSLDSLGKLSRELIEARADGIITRDEFTAIDLRKRRLIGDLQRAISQLETQVVDPAEHGIKAVR